MSRGNTRSVAPARSRRTAATGLAAGAAALPLMADRAIALGPMSYLEADGARAQMVLPLLWGLLAISVLVVVVISALVLVAIFRRRQDEDALPEGEGWLPVVRGPGGLPWIYGGLIATTVILAGFVAWTMTTMTAISAPPQDPAFTIEITGHQWWWEARYVVHDQPNMSFETANELHVPVGVPVRLRLTSADVIHSFWIPAISGKTDLIPGRVNETWLQADRAGVYRGQCAEYCGQQHAHMAMRLFADTPDEFEAWWKAQLEPADAPETEPVRNGLRQFLLNCGVCHTVRGTPAGGEVGPDLTHLMSRTTIAANMLPNTIGHLSGWIANPQHIKPESKMPNLDLSGPQLAALRNYLLTLE